VRKNTISWRGDGPHYLLSDFKPNPGEVSGIAKNDADDGLRLFGGGASVNNVKGLFLKGRKWTNESITVAANSFVPRSDGYYQKIFILAKNYLNGEKIYLS